jgi:hypothetical protein
VYGKNPHSLQELKDNIQPEMFEDNTFKRDQELFRSIKLAI